MSDREYATREPLPPPFAVGTRLRYKGRRTETDSEGRTLLAPGLEVEVVRVVTGDRGTGRVIGYSGSRRMLHETRDGASVYEVAGEGRMIHRAGAYEWEVV